MSAEKQKTILLVEDESIIAMSEKLALERYGYAVIIADSGEAAVAAVEKTPAIDLILMDINLGAGMDGSETAEIILRQRDLPVVFLSSHAEPEIVARTEKITSYGYVVKNSGDTVLQASIMMAFKLFKAKIMEKEKEAALWESEASYRALFSGASDGILLADAQTRQFRNANPAICRMLGYTEDEFQRLSVTDIHPKGFMDHVLAEFASLARGEIRFSPELPCLRKDGTVFYADISHSAVTLEGREYHAGFFHDITERRQLNNVIKESELRLKAQYRGLPIPTFTWRKKGEDFELIDFNDAAKTTTHEKTSEFVGRKASDLYAGRQDILQDLQQCSVEGKIIKRETLSEHFMPGKPIALTIVPIPSDLIMVHMEDISERKRAESEKEAALAALRKNEKMFRNMAEQLGDVLFTTDDHGTITYITPSAYRVFGRLPEEMIGRKFIEFLVESDIPKALQAFQTTISTGQPNRNLSLLMKRRDGSFFIGELKGSPIDRKLGILGTLGLIRDITERKRAEAETDRQLAEKVILLKEVHHRIKNNIASVSGLLSLRLQSITNPEAVAVLQDAIGRVNSMRLLYDKLLLSDGYEDISVKNYIESLADLVVALFPDKAKITLDKRIVDFQLDSKRLFPLGIIINELITNKMKYAFSGRETGKIKITLKKIDKQVKLIIEDNGNGLPDEFDINKSTGFGLTLVKMLSQQLGGNFSIEKRSGTRCTVEFNI